MDKELNEELTLETDPETKSELDRLGITEILENPDNWKNPSEIEDDKELESLTDMGVMRIVSRKDILGIIGLHKSESGKICWVNQEIRGDVHAKDKIRTFDFASVSKGKISKVNKSMYYTKPNYIDVEYKLLKKDALDKIDRIAVAETQRRGAHLIYKLVRNSMVRIIDPRESQEK